MCMCRWKLSVCYHLFHIRAPIYSENADNSPLPQGKMKEQTERWRATNWRMEGTLNSGPMSCAHHQTFCLCVWIFLSVLSFLLEFGVNSFSMFSLIMLQLNNFLWQHIPFRTKKKEKKSKNIFLWRKKRKKERKKEYEEMIKENNKNNTEQRQTYGRRFSFYFKMFTYMSVFHSVSLCKN